MKSLLKLKNVNLKYQIGNELIKVLQNINLETKKNESISIVGESGSGKTSLIMLIGGLEKVTSGKINFEDQEISQNSNEFNRISNEASANNRNSILKSYDYLLNSKYKIDVNEKTIDRVKNYFR